jgi:hypothetical protein
MGYRVHSLSIVLAVVGAAAMACGSTSGSAPSSTWSSPEGNEPSASSSGDFGNGTSSGQPADAPITVEPGSPTLTIVSRTTPLTQTFVAKSNNAEVNAGWVLDHYDVGSISQQGVFTTTGLVSGKMKVTAKYKNHQATADLTVQVKIAEDLAVPPSAPNKTALSGQPTLDPGGANASKILYPLDGTVMPRGLTSPLLQFSPGSIVPEDAKISLTCSTFSWEGYGHVPNESTPQMQIPQDVWDAFMQSCGGEEATISIVKANGGVAYGPYVTKLVVAATTLKGAVFYQSYQAENLGLWSVRPGVKEPAKHLIKKCVVCHSVSANGETLTTGMENGGPESGAYRTSLDGTITQVSATPATLGGDSRGLSFAFLTPDGKYVLRSENDFWGGANTKAFKIDPAGTPTSTLAEATVNGLENISAYLPIFSPDGKKIAFVNGDGDAQGTPRKSVSVMDAVVDPAAGSNGTLTFSNQVLAIDNQPDGLVTKFPTFLPDSTTIVLQEGVNNWHDNGGMLASFNDFNTGKLFMIRGSEHIELAKANTGTSAGDYDQNFEPTALPVTAGGYFWVVFTSQRVYGNSITTRTKQLWVAAISPTSAPNIDPSHPAFYLPNQSSSENERGFWALEPCKADGAGCGTGDECCNGFCRPSDDANPASPKVCKAPVAGQCSAIGDKCTTAKDCCDTDSSCIGGFCTPPAPR